MRSRRRIVGALATAATGAGLTLGLLASPGGAQTQERGIRGEFSTILMVHTAQSTPQYQVAETRPWDGRRRRGATFSYRSIPCTGAAPVNNISSDLPSYNGRVEGSRAPSSLRGHPFAFRVERTRRYGWVMRGLLELTVCQLGPGPVAAPDPVPDARKPKIRMRFRAQFRRVNGEVAHWAGRFEIIGGTQRYAGLTGSGRIAGYFFCFDPAGCQAKGGRYLDGQMVLQGRYADPTPQLGG